MESFQKVRASKLDSLVQKINQILDNTPGYREYQSLPYPKPEGSGKWRLHDDLERFTREDLLPRLERVDQSLANKTIDPARGDLHTLSDLDPSKFDLYLNHPNPDIREIVEQAIDFSEFTLKEYEAKYGLKRIAPKSGDAFSIDKHHVYAYHTDAIVTNPQLEGRISKTVSPGWEFNGKITRANIIRHISEGRLKPEEIITSKQRLFHHGEGNFEIPVPTQEAAARPKQAPDPKSATSPKEDINPPNRPSSATNKAPTTPPTPRKGLKAKAEKASKVESSSEAPADVPKVIEPTQATSSTKKPSPPKNRRATEALTQPQPVPEPIITPPVEKKITPPETTPLDPLPSPPVAPPPPPRGGPKLKAPTGVNSADDVISKFLSKNSKAIGIGAAAMGIYGAIVAVNSSGQQKGKVSRRGKGSYALDYNYGLAGAGLVGLTNKIRGGSAAKGFLAASALFGVYTDTKRGQSTKSALLTNSIAAAAGTVGYLAVKNNSELIGRSLTSFLSQFHWGAEAVGSWGNFLKSSPTISSILSKNNVALGTAALLVPLFHGAAQRKFARQRKKGKPGQEVMATITAENTAGRPTPREQGDVAGPQNNRVKYTAGGQIRSTHNVALNGLI